MEKKTFRKEKTAALLLAAGKGTRFGGETPKQFLSVDEEPMVLYAIDALLPHVDRLVLVVAEEERDRAETILENAGLARDVRVVAGGTERYDSSLSGLLALEEDGPFDYVLIHDAARCLVTEDLVERILEGVKQYGAVVPGIPAKDTVKRVSPDGRVLDTPDRRECIAVQTPQAFRTEWIEEAYQNAKERGGLSSLTDDASAVERFTDHPVMVVSGSEENFKVTTPFDFLLAETVLTMRRLKRESEKR